MRSLWRALIDWLSSPAPSETPAERALHDEAQAEGIEP